MADRVAVVRLFGRFEVVSADGRPVRFATERSRRLLVLLVLAGGAPCSRERLSGGLWEDGDELRSRNSLNTEVWRLRRSLTEAGEDPAAWLASSGPDLAFKRDSRVDVDLLRFDDLLRQAESTRDPAGREQALTQAVQLYAGELTPGIYDNWCLLAREAYRSRSLAALERLLELHRDARRWGEAIAVARRILQEDPFLEHVHRELMRCHALMGDRAAALRHFDSLKRSLRRELDVEPTAETRALHSLLRSDAEVLAAAGPALARPAAAWADPRLRAVRRQLLLAARELGALTRHSSKAFDS